MNNTSHVWWKDWKILFDKHHITEFIPYPSLSLEERINAMTRTILFVSILGIIITKSILFLSLGILFLGCIIVLYHMKKKSTVESMISDIQSIQTHTTPSTIPQESNSSLSPSSWEQEEKNNEQQVESEKGKITNKYKGIMDSQFDASSGIVHHGMDTRTIPKEKMRNYLNVDTETQKEIDAHFTSPTSENPMMNVGLYEYQDDPTRKPALPAFNTTVRQGINKARKETLDDKLFRDLGDDIQFHQGMRDFHTMPSTTIPNDQHAFAQFCYGNMKSCKEGHELQCTKWNQRHIQR